MTILQIVGYEPEHGCDHCGRALLHGIALSDGRVVGATCFDKKLTKPKEYNGRKYRVGAEEIIRLARNARKSDQELRRMGLSIHHFQFTSV